MANNAAHTLNQYTNHADLITDLSVKLIEGLQAAIEQDGRASIAFSGGSTPKPLFNYLATLDFDWSKVDVTLVDERCVPATHERSNAKLLDDNMLARLSNKPRFFPLFESQPEELAAQLKQPFDVAILGMGGDGHTASFFPDADNLADLIIADDAPKLMQTQSAASKEPRLTWNLAALLQSRFLALHITGEGKHAVLQEAINDAGKYPVGTVIHQHVSPLAIYYSPTA